jgi:hypothetical protein
MNKPKLLTVFAVALSLLGMFNFLRADFQAIQPAVFAASPSMFSWDASDFFWSTSTINMTFQLGSIWEPHLFSARNLNYDYSNNTWGVLWAEFAGNTGVVSYYGGSTDLTSTVLYNSSSCVIIQWASSSSSARVVVTYYLCFYSSVDYFIFGYNLTRTNNYETGTNEDTHVATGSVIRYLGTLQFAVPNADGTVYSADSNGGDVDISYDDTWEQRMQSFPWQAIRDMGPTNTTYAVINVQQNPNKINNRVTSTWDSIDNLVGEEKWQTYVECPNTYTNFLLPSGWVFSGYQVIFPYQDDQAANWYSPVQSLASSLYQGVYDSQGYNFPTLSGYDLSGTGECSELSNKVGILEIGGGTESGGVRLFNTTVWNYYDLQTTFGGFATLPMYIRPNSYTPYLSFVLTNSSGDSQYTVDNGQAAYGTISNGSVSPAYIGMARTQGSAALNMTWQTWNDSDKFYLTMSFNITSAMNVTSIWTKYIVDSTDGWPTAPTFTSLDASAGDYVLTEPSGCVAGVCYQWISGNVTNGVSMDGTGVKIFLANYTSQQKNIVGYYTATIKIFPHYGSLSSASQITGDHTAPTIVPKPQHYALNLLNATIPFSYDCANSTILPYSVTQPTANSFTMLAYGTAPANVAFNYTAWYTALGNPANIYVNGTSAPFSYPASDVASVLVNFSKNTANITVVFAAQPASIKTVHLLLTEEPATATYAEGQSVTFTVDVLNQLSQPLNSTLTLTVTGPGGYCYLDFQTINVTANAVGEYSFDWNTPSVAGTYYVEVGLVPPQLTAYDAAWLEVV